MNSLYTNILSLLENHVSDFIKTLIITILVTVFLYLFKITMYAIKARPYFIIEFFRYAKFIIFKRRYILIWNDHDIELSKSLSSHLKKEYPKFNYKQLKDPCEIFKFPLKYNFTYLVIFLVTDVTKLSNIDTIRNKIEQKLIEYVKDGGVLFGMHDLIYKRCRNTKIEESFGCTLDSFERFDVPIKVKLTEKYANHVFNLDLPENFYLDDGELCWGDWDKGSHVLIETYEKISKNNNKRTPVFIFRYLGRGLLLWINSCDKQKTICGTLNTPISLELLTILKNVVKNISNIKNKND